MDDDAPLIPPSYKEPTDRQFAQTLANGLDILLSFKVGDSLLGNKELSERTGLSRPTVARLTHTLCQLGYLRADSAHRKFRLGSATLTIGHSVLVGMRIRQISRPLLRELASSVGGMASLARQANSQMLYVETAVSSKAAELRPDVGSALPMLTTSCGRAWLCSAPRDESSSVLNRLKVQNPDLHFAMQVALTRARQDYQTLGYCASRGEWHANVLAVATPLRKQVDGQLFVLNCAVKGDSQNFPHQEAVLVYELLEAARRLEAIMGMD
jgi:DNA-binding IclR family transcriptional regulator